MVNFKDIANEAIQYYSKLYKKDQGGRPIIENLFHSHTPEEKASWFEKCFEESEVKEVVFWMDGAKAPRPDGYSMLFYHKCWETIKDDLIKVFRNSMTEGWLLLIGRI